MGRPFPGAVLLLGGALFLFGGCAAGVAPRAGGDRSAAGEARVLERVPFLPQEEESCGPSSLAMVLRYYGERTETGEIVRETRTEGLRGTLITDLAAAARRRGYSAEIENLTLSGLRERIRSGIPVILLVDLGRWVFSRPHYLVAYGFTPEAVVAHSGRERGKVIPLTTIDRQWRTMNRLALVVRRVSR
ncbi:MAG: C39 family peptidase [Deltaproteobacteria bacterium]